MKDSWATQFDVERYEEQTRQTVESLQNRLTYVSHLNDEHLQELASIKQQNIRLIRSLNSMKACQRRLNHHQQQDTQLTVSYLNTNSNLIDESINEKTDDSLLNGFHVPLPFSYLRHLTGKYDMLSPSFRRQSSNSQLVRSNVSFILAIPTVKRDKQSYLIETIKSLIDNLNGDDLDRILIVIFIAEPFDLEYVRTTAHALEKLYEKYIDSGLMEIISPPPEFYPDFDQLKLTLNDDKPRVKWRTKQNYDFTYLMMYSARRGRFYIQLEDDVVTKPGYIRIMEHFIQQQKSPDWFMLEYSALGFIGKMFHTEDLDSLVNFFLIFAADKPIDWLLEQ